MGFHKLEVGKTGEEIATKFLKSRGFQILARNFRTNFGELDIVAQKENKISFVEVKTRIGLTKGKPYEAVNKGKLNRLKKAVNYYLLNNNCKDVKLSFDVVSIVLNDSLKPEKIDYFQGMEI